MREQSDKFRKYALALVMLGALGRLLMTLPPVDRPGDPSYLQMAQDILRFNFHALGDRTPLYPLFIALCGLNLRVVWVAQSILGITASLMIFDLAFRRTRHSLFSCFVGLACSLIPELIIFEGGVMAETLTSFLLVTSVWLFTRGDGAAENNFRYPFSMGLTVALAGLTRPLMICLVPVYYCFLNPVWLPAKMLRREALRRTCFFALPICVFILGWCGFNYLNSGYFTPTTRAGQQLMDQVDPYVDLAPERFAVLRNAWIQSRQHSPHTPDEIEDVYYRGALPEVERQTGKTEIQVSHEFASLALYLEIHHPLLCLRRAELGWIQFWGEPSPEEVEWRQGGGARLTEFAMAMANMLVREIKGIFLVLALASIPCSLFRVKAFSRQEHLIFAVALMVSVCAAFTEFGSNRRFCVPLYMLIVYTVLTRGWIWITATSPRAGAISSDLLARSNAQNRP
ncbi:MAG: hypothetical protein ACLQVG_03345 [Terriglobia bacterium]